MSTYVYATGKLEFGSPQLLEKAVAPLRKGGWLKPDNTMVFEDNDPADDGSPVINGHELTIPSGSWRNLGRVMPDVLEKASSGYYTEDCDDGDLYFYHWNNGVEIEASHDDQFAQFLPEGEYRDNFLLDQDEFIEKYPKTKDDAYWDARYEAFNTASNNAQDCFIKEEKALKHGKALGWNKMQIGAYFKGNKFYDPLQDDNSENDNQGYSGYQATNKLVDEVLMELTEENRIEYCLKLKIGEKQLQDHLLSISPEQCGKVFPGNKSIEDYNSKESLLKILNRLYAVNDEMSEFIEKTRVYLNEHSNCPGYNNVKKAIASGRFAVLYRSSGVAGMSEDKDLKIIKNKKPKNNTQVERSISR
jgi:hypothetical protein